MKVAIVGGGIGGLATALAMTQAGFTVAVYERSAQLVDQGAGITLAPNATRVLYHLGLGPTLEETAVTPPQTEYRHYRTGCRDHAHDDQGLSRALWRALSAAAPLGFAARNDHASR
jgi:salicylate hydroxylase